MSQGMSSPKVFLDNIGGERRTQPPKTLPPMKRPAILVEDSPSEMASPSHARSGDKSKPQAPVRPPSRAKTIKRPRANRRDAANSVPKIMPQAHLATIQEYLRNHFLDRPVALLTKDGRVQGKLAAVSSQGVTLTAVGKMPLQVSLDHILSVAHQPSSTSSES